MPRYALCGRTGMRNGGHGLPERRYSPRCFTLYTQLYDIVPLNMKTKMTEHIAKLQCVGSGSFEVKGNGANRKPMGGFLSDLHWIQRPAESARTLCD